jgi:hypothetical protein
MTSLRAAAIATVAAHLLGLGFAAFGMRPGTPLVPIAERMRYLASSPPGWILGWLVWIVCALSFAVFFAALGPRLAPSTRRAAWVCVILAVVTDLICDTAQIFLAPAYARGGEAGFLALERALGLGGALVANSLYVAAVLVANAVFQSQAARRLGWATGVAGLALSVGGLLDMPRLIEIATGPTMLLFCAWTLAASMEES